MQRKKRRLILKHPEWGGMSEWWVLSNLYFPLGAFLYPYFFCLSNNVLILTSEKVM